MGWDFGRISGFLNFLDFRLVVCLVSSGIVLYIRAVFSNAGVGVHDLHYKQIPAISGRTRAPEFLGHLIVFGGLHSLGVLFV